MHFAPIKIMAARRMQCQIMVVGQFVGRDLRIWSVVPDSRPLPLFVLHLPLHPPREADPSVQNDVLNRKNEALRMQNGNANRSVLHPGAKWNHDKERVHWRWIRTLRLAIPPLSVVPPSRWTHYADFLVCSLAVTFPEGLPT